MTGYLPVPSNRSLGTSARFFLTRRPHRDNLIPIFYAMHGYTQRSTQAGAEARKASLGEETRSAMQEAAAATKATKGEIAILNEVLNLCSLR